MDGRVAGGCRLKHMIDNKIQLIFFHEDGTCGISNISNGSAMGLISWVSSTARKSAAAAVIQTYFQLSKRYGLFDAGPAKSADRVIKIACESAPELAERRFNRYVLAAGALAIAIAEADEPYEMRFCFASALAAMLKVTLEVGPSLSHTEQEMLRISQMLYFKFYDENAASNTL
jgi:hypothetical protein